ncbi:hypothetical protein U9M48_032463 [Paspalum notatum var. saurae]|uniref:glucan endo-1,3-beta-D-glucosidase n=1 Tax=Paspalum notatum var. saurae TaxID=547442 RepID=A0AAQ3U9D4_PASNO
MAVAERSGARRPSSRSIVVVLLLVVMLIADGGVEVPRAEGLSIGINYGQIADNLPSPSRVSWLLRSMQVSKVKLYDADPHVLSAFLDTDVEFVVGIGNENVSAMVDPAAAQAWIQRHVQPYLPSTRITCITVGNEVFKGNDTALKANLLPAMQSVYQALAALGLQGRVNVTTAHSLDIMGTSFPPSAGAFRADVVPYMQPLLGFLSMARSPFLINCYPYFAYKADPGNVPLAYVLFQPNAGVTDTNTKLNYDNMLYAQVDSVYAAIQALGHTDIDVKISETGWPSGGDPDEAGATPEYAGTYIGNLLQRIEMKQGTPLRPSVPIDVYVFALFNENLKPGPASERHYGLFYPDGTPVYNVGLRGYLPPMDYSRGTRSKVVQYHLSLIIMANHIRCVLYIWMKPPKPSFADPSFPITLFSYFSHDSDTGRQ